MMDKYSQKRFDVLKEDAIDREALEAIDYAYPGKEIVVEYFTEEFTSVCPWSGLPDFGRLSIKYVPDRLLIELKSLKYYLLSYRQVGILQEHAVNQILQDLVVICQPIKMTVEMEFSPRGGIGTKVTASYERKKG
ncbi:MAG: NADPH-dependent 7-cyano-7-deazaguanine reductase QueF [Firmicutes bacterium]|nr:NADPH-dependent 7-cyano-7-deazaguanine reductase QueF [Bacillota bacterium]